MSINATRSIAGSSLPTGTCACQLTLRLPRSSGVHSVNFTDGIAKGWTGATRSSLSSCSTSLTPKSTPCALNWRLLGPVKTTYTHTTASFDNFDLWSADEIRRIITTSQSKASELDPQLTDILKQFLLERLPYISDKGNASLQQGCLPSSQSHHHHHHCHAIVTPSLKKAGLHAANCSSYRRIFNLTFLSKMVEELVCHQLVACWSTAS